MTTPTVTSQAKDQLSGGVALASFAIVIIAWAAIAIVLPDASYGTGSVSAPLTGLSLFAALFVAAQAIERLLEPFADLVDSEESLLPTMPGHANRKVLFWALASTVGMVAAAVTHVYLLATIGIAHPTHAVEVLATGLVIGAGTKPLHDLVILISAKANAANT